MNTEPVIALVLGMIAAGIALLAAFGVNVTEEQTAAIGGFAAAALAFGFYVRSKVTPTAKTAGRAGERGLTLLEAVIVLLVVAVVVLLVVTFR